MELETQGDIFLQAMQSESKQKSSEDMERNNKILTGIVAAINSGDVFIDLGKKSECIVPLTEFKVPPTLGSNLEVIIKENRDGLYIASKLEADKIRHIDLIRKSLQDDLPISGTIESVILKDAQPKGFNVNLSYNIKAFLPLSHMDVRNNSDLNTLVGNSLDFVVISMEKNNITVSRRDYVRKTMKKMYHTFFQNNQVGQTVQGKVERVENNFVVLNVQNVSAFMHISDFSWKYLENLTKYIKIGDTIDVKIIELNPAENSVKVGKKQLTPNPWDAAALKYKQGDVVKGKVIGYRKDGAIIELEDGVEAYISTDEMSWTEKARDPKKHVKLGDIVEAKIIQFEPEKKKAHLSLREITANPWAGSEDKYSYGRKLLGIATSIADFGVFVRFDDGIEGLLRKEDVDWNNAEIDLRQKFKKDDKIEVVVLSFDPTNEKLRLGVKQLSPSPYKSFSLNYPVGSKVNGTVKSLIETGAVISLENDLEAFIHISQISKEKVEKTQDALKIGDTITAMVKNIDSSKNKIELSIKELLVKEEKSEVKKYLADDKLNHSSPFEALLKNKLNNTVTSADDSSVNQKKVTKLKPE